MSQKFLNPVEVNGYVSAEYLDLSTTTSHSVNAGEIAWNSVDGTFDIGLLNGVTLQAGQEMHFYGKATEAISNGNAVMFAGVQGDHILIAKANAVTINANPEYFMGVATQDFATNDFGYVTAFGNIRGINTSAYTLGDILYYDSTSATDGLLTPAEPSAPNAKIIVAAVVKVHATQGILAVRPHTMPRLKDIQDINIDTASAGEILQLQSDGVWENKTLSEAGIQPTLTNPVTGTGTTNYVAKFTGTTSLGNSQIFDNGTNVGIGTSSPSEKLEVQNGTSGAKIKVSNAVGGYATLECSSNATSVAQLSFTNQLSLIGGNVGIGTTSPSAKLNVSGDIHIGDYGSASSRALDFRTSNSVFTITTDGTSGGLGTTFTYSWANGGQGPLKFNNAAGEVMRLSSTGNVGIGTTSPSYILDLLSSNPRLRVKDSSTGYSILDLEGGRGSFYVANDNSTGSLFGGSAYAGTLYRVGAYPIAMWTDGAERMRITSTGNVGIGNTSPTNKLIVDSNTNGADGIVSRNLNTGGSAYAFVGAFNNANNGIDLRSHSSTNAVYPSTSFLASSSGQTGGLIISQAGTNPIMFLTNWGERMRITSSGNVGIGTSSPNEKLTVSGKIYANPNQPVVLSGLGAPYYGTNITLASDIGSTQGANRIWSRYDGTGSGAITFERSTNSQAYNSDPQLLTYTESMRIAGNGNVGIGTTSPVTKLDMTDALRIQSSTFSAPASGTGLELRNVAGVGSILSYDRTNDLYKPLTFDGSDITIKSNGNNRIYLNSSGNVGIGTTSPGAKLHVAGEGVFDDNTYGRLTLGFASSQNDIYSTTTGFGAWKNFRLNANELIFSSGGTTERMRITSSGNVGIGTTSPTTKLHIIDASSSVNPSIKVTHDIALINQSIEVIGSAFDGGGIVSVDTNANLIFKRGGSESMRIDGEGKVGIGASSPDSSAILHLQSTKKGFLPPVMKDDERAAISSPAQGLMIFNSDTKRLNVFDGDDWQIVAWA